MKRPSGRTVLQVSAPLVAIATLMLGLRVGAKDAVRAAVVNGALPGKHAQGEKTRLAWQLVTFLDDRGVKETIAVKDIEVVARSKNDVARWKGSTNEDGIAEVELLLEGLAPYDDVFVEVKAAGDPVPLAAGHVEWEKQPWPTPPTPQMVPPNKKSGDVDLTVVIQGGRLVTGFATPLWVHARPEAVAAAGLTIDVEPEPGLRADTKTVTACANGWAEVPLVAEAHVTGAKLLATSTSHPETKGEWFGALPVAAGAFYPSIDPVLPARTEATAVLIAPNPRNVVYAEIDTINERVFAAALHVAVEPGDPTPRAKMAIPPLEPGQYWLVVSGEPRGAEHLSGATITRPFFVREKKNMYVACEDGPDLAQRAPPADGFPRWIALDGLPARSAGNRGKHRLGLLIAMVALTAAGLLEAILLAAASREARVQLQLAELDEGVDAEKVTAKPPGGGLAIAILAAVLGFALLAALLFTKS
jgi:hypothetical protein